MIHLLIGLLHVSSNWADMFSCVLCQIQLQGGKLKSVPSSPRALIRKMCCPPNCIADYKGDSVRPAGMSDWEVNNASVAVVQRDPGFG